MDIKEINSFEELIDSLKYIEDKKEIEMIKKAYDYASVIHKNDKRKSKKEYMHHPLNVAYILTDLYADSDTICASLLHDTIHIGNDKIENIEKEFGEDIALLVNGITKINKLNVFTDSESQINYYKKIIVGLTEDVRIIIIKLAERCENMRTLYVLSEQKRL